MYFRVLEHYDEDKNAEPIIHDCFICMEYKTKKGETTIPLIYQTIYINKCSCNGWIHNECLGDWFKFKRKCPICRVKVQKIYINLSPNAGLFGNINIVKFVFYVISFYTLFLFIYQTWILGYFLDNDSENDYFDDDKYQDTNHNNNFELQKYYNFTIPMNFIRPY